MTPVASGFELASGDARALCIILVTETGGYDGSLRPSLNITIHFGKRFFGWTTTSGVWMDTHGHLIEQCRLFLGWKLAAITFTSSAHAPIR